MSSKKTQGQAPERRIIKLRAEIESIESFFYGAKDGDNDDAFFMLKIKRDNVIRGMILELHLSIEDLLNGVIKSHILSTKTGKELVASSAVDELLVGERAMGFKQKIIYLKAASLIRPQLFNDLDTLNRLRNKAGHNWTLNRVIRKKIKRNKRKRPLLEYKGRNLYQHEVIKEFIAHYGRIYYRLWLKFA